MGRLKLINDIINQRGTPAFNSNTFANRPAAGYVGRIFISTDTFVIQRDNGTGWDSLGGGGGISGSGAAGQVTFWTGASAVSGDNAIFWDNTNKRLGLGTTTPGTRLDVHGTGVIQQLNGTTTNNAYLDFQNAGTTQWRVGNTYNGGNRLFQIIDQPTATPIITINNNKQIAFGLLGTTFFASVSKYEIYNTPGAISEISVINNIGATGAGSMAFGWYYTRTNTQGTYSATQNNDVFVNFNCFGSTNTSFTPLSGGLSWVQSGSVAANAPTISRWSASNSANVLSQMYIDGSIGAAGYSGRFNIANATDNANFELNVNGNTYTGGISPTILTVSTNTTMARTATGYRCTATLTLTLPAVSGLNQWYIVINDSTGTVTINRNGTDTIVNTAGTSVTSLTLTANARTMLYLGGGTITYQIF